MTLKTVRYKRFIKKISRTLQYRFLRIIISLIFKALDIPTNQLYIGKEV